jgi:hypothetical protein
VQTVPCPHCSEPIRATATFCLACDTPVADTDRGLSVAHAVPASVGRPVVGLAVALACVALLGGAAYGGLRIYRHAHAASATQARADVRRGLALVVSAESGQTSACHPLEAVVAPPASKALAQCRAIVGDDRSARLGNLSVGQPHLGKGAGTVDVKATIDDRSGTHTVDETVPLVEVRRHWRMAWDGRSAVAASSP